MRLSFIILVALSLGCSKKDAAAPAEPEQAAETEAAAAEESGGAADPGVPLAAVDEAQPLPAELQGETPDLSAPPTVKVLEPGKEPRQKLRWAFKPGQEQKVSMKVGFAVDAVLIMLAVKSPEYVVDYDLTLSVEKVGKDGTARIAFKADAASIENLSGFPERYAKQYAQALAGMQGVKGHYSLDSRGTISDIELDLPEAAKRATADMADSFRWALTQMSVMTPAEPVGDGAKWTAHRALQQGAILVNHLSTVEVVKLESGRVELAVKIEQSAGRQTYENPGTYAKLELVSLRGPGDASISWGLGELMPQKAAIDASVQKGVLFKNPKEPEKKADAVIVATRTLRIGKD